MRIIAILAASYTAAVVLAVYGRLDAALLPLGGVCALTAAFFMCLNRHRSSRNRKKAALIGLGLALGFSWTAGYRALFLAPAKELENRTVRMTAQVLQWPQRTHQGWSVLVRTETEDGVWVDALLYLDEQGRGLRPGDQIQSVVHCEPADRSSSGEEITYYTAKGVFLRGSAYGTLHVERPERPPLRAIPALMSRALEDSIRSAFPRQEGGQVLAIVLGNRDSLTRSFTTSMQRAGLSHTAAVSGMHLSFLAAFLTCLLGKHRRRTAWIIMPVMLIFMVTAGCTPSVTRATVMILLLLAAPLFGRERDDATALGTALLVLLVQNPLAVTHVGLQLSFAAVAGIFLTAEPISRALREKLCGAQAKPWTLRWVMNLVPGYLADTLAATFGAMVFTLPLTALHFSSVSLISPLANFVTLWAVAGIFCGGLLVGLAGMLSPALAQLLALAVAPLARYMDWAVRWLARLPFASITMDSVYYKLWVCILSAGILAALVRKRRRRFYLPASLAVITLCTAALLTSIEFGAGDMSVTAFDVGQGQCVLVRQGKFLTLVDCGGDSYDSAGDIAANHIQNAGRNGVDLLVLSHFHSDHANGVPQLLERLKVGAIAIPEVDEDSPLRREILALAKEREIPVWVVTRDSQVRLGGDRDVTIFAPLGRKDINERGLTVLASSGENQVLLTGDMGAEVERILVGHTTLPQVEVMLAGHHGSKYSNSQALLEAARPRIVLISAGQHNRFGHPDPETLERFGEIPVYRTDQCGTIQIRLDH